MSSLEHLVKTTSKKKRRLGRGHGSGRGKTAGRGTKGQKARGDVPAFFEGGALSIIKRLPFRRGKGKNKPIQKGPVIINIKALNLLPKGAIIDVATLTSHRIVDTQDAKQYGVKVLGDGVLTIPLTVRVPVSKSAAKKIEKAGGKVELPHG